jgi:adenylate cyclase
VTRKRRRLSRDDLVREATAQPDVVDDLIRRRILRPAPDGGFAPGDVVRVEAVTAFLEAGVAMERIQAALDTGEFTFEYLHRFYPEPAARTGPTPAALAADLGVDLEVLASCYLAAGLPEPASGLPLRADEALILREFVTLWGQGEDGLVRAARLVGEPARQVAEGWTRLFVERVSDPLREAGLDGGERIEAIVAGTERATSLLPSMLQWLLVRHLSHAIDRANIEGMEAGLVAHGLLAPPDRPPPAVAFVDLSGFTSRTAAAGDRTAVVLSDQLRERALQAVRADGGRLVKLLGDGALLVFGDGACALRAVLRLVETLGRDGLPAHAGINAGPVVEHDGDVYGSTVNLAARVGSVAAAGEVVVTSAVLAAPGNEGVPARSLGLVPLAGVPAPAELFLALGPGDPAESPRDRRT